MAEMREPVVESEGRGASGTRDGRGARIAFTVVTLLFAAASLGALFGIGLIIGWIDTDSAGIHRVHDLSYGVLYGVLTTTAFAAMARRPETKPAAWYQVL